MTHSSRGYDSYRFSGGVLVIGAENVACASGSTGLCLIVFAGSPRGRCRPSSFSSLVGRGMNPPPQFGHTFSRTSSTHAGQNVHSYEHIRASSESGGSGLLQCSHVGRSSSIGSLLSGAWPASTQACSSWFIVIKH